MNDKFDIDDILAEFDDDKKKSVNNEKNGKETNATPATSGKNPGATMILRSIDEKKKAEAANRTSQKSTDTKEIPKQSIKHMKADIGDKYKPHNTEKKPESLTSVKNGKPIRAKLRTNACRISRKKKRLSQRQSRLLILRQIILSILVQKPSRIKIPPNIQ